MLLTKFFARRGYLRKPRDGFSLLKEGFAQFEKVQQHLKAAW